MQTFLKGLIRGFDFNRLKHQGVSRLVVAQTHQTSHQEIRVSSGDLIKIELMCFMPFTCSLVKFRQKKIPGGVQILNIY